jgi:hypothetical protein
MKQVLPLLGLLLVAACAQPDAGDTAEALQEALAAHRASAAGIGGRPVAAAVEGSDPAPRPPARPVAQGAAAASGQAPTMAGELVGQTPDVVLRWLGEPRLRREEGAAEIWHYQAAQCHLDLVLYQDTGQPILRVAFAAARAVGTARRGEAACLRDIVRGAARPVPATAVGALGA